MSTSDPNYRDKPDFTLTWLRHMDRVNQASAMQDGVYEAYVRQQFRLLPSKMKAWVMAQRDTFTEQKRIYKVKSPCGSPVGSVDEPVLKDETKPVKRLTGPIDWTDPNIKGRKNTGTKKKPIYEPILYDVTLPVKRLTGPIDWTDPNILSPRLVKEEYVDYEAFNNLILMASEKSGFGWEEENTNSIKGKKDG